MRAYVEAYGCTLNFGEAREIEDLLAAKGWEICDSNDGCDLTVLATCVVIDTTERAMLKRIRELASSRRLIITGCMATACREKAERIAPSALFVAPGDLKSFSALIGSQETLHDARGVHRESYGIVPIATGCRGKCAYCITRLARGDLKSRPVSKVVESVQSLVKDGPREVQFTAQDSAAYGVDVGTDLPSLVESACQLPYDFRLRLGMMNPRSAMRLKGRLGQMFSHKKVFKFIHLPVQTASDDLLQAMNRGYTMADFRSLVSEVRAKVPEITVSTDLIVGYPGETAAHHRTNLDLVSEIAPDIVNVTRFSARPGTEAAASGNQIVGWKAKDRSREITKLRFRVALQKNRKWVGRTVVALATERGKGRSTILRTDEYKQVVIPSVIPLGGFHSLRVVDATSTYLVGAIGGEQ